MSKTAGYLASVKQSTKGIGEFIAAAAVRLCHGAGVPPARYNGGMKLSLSEQLQVALESGYEIQFNKSLATGQFVVRAVRYKGEERQSSEWVIDQFEAKRATARTLDDFFADAVSVTVDRLEERRK